MTANFLEAPGTNGFIIAPFTVLTTELNATGIGALSTLGAAKSQTTSGSGIWGHIWFKAGGGFTPVGAPNIAGWFIISTDGGTTFEISSATPARSPDFIIPLAAAAYNTNDIVMAPGLVKLWFPTIKVLVLNNSGVALPASGNTITVGPVAIAY